PLNAFRLASAPSGHPGSRRFLENWDRAPKQIASDGAIPCPNLEPAGAPVGACASKIWPLLGQRSFGIHFLVIKMKSFSCNEFHFFIFGLREADDFSAVCVSYGLAAGVWPAAFPKRFWPASLSPRSMSGRDYVR